MHGASQARNMIVLIVIIIPLMLIDLSTLTTYYAWKENMLVLHLLDISRQA